MKRIIVDLDGTLTIDEKNVPYEDKKPNKVFIEKLRAYKSDGFEIVIATARNMRTYGGSIGHINANTLPVVIDWLNRHKIPYDEIHVGKPWCGHDGFYIDDKAVRPSEFISMDYCDILKVLKNEERGRGPDL